MPSQRTPSEQVAAFIASVVDYLALHPELLRLDSLGFGVLEKNMTTEALFAYKRDFTEHLRQAGSRIDEGLQLEEGRGVKILMRTYALARGLWQSTQHDKETLKLDLAPGLMLTPDVFSEELREALTEYWWGALPGNPSSA